MAVHRAVCFFRGWKKTFAIRVHAKDPDVPVEALEGARLLREAAQRAGRDDVIDFAEQLMRHARTEEAVMYPAAILVGELVRQRLGLRAAQAS